MQDLAGLFAAVDTDSASELFIITSPAICKRWAVQTTSTGELAFPGMGPTGGQIANTPVLVTDAALGQIIVADAHQVVAAAGSIELDRTQKADIQLDTAPDSPLSGSTTLRSLW